MPFIVEQTLAVGIDVVTPMDKMVNYLHPRGYFVFGQSNRGPTKSNRVLYFTQHADRDVL